MIPRALGAIVAIAVALAPSHGVARDQEFLSRPIVVIVPWPAGGTTDIAMRALAAATEKHLGQAIVIENRPGAGGTLGPMQMAATASPDGYTLSQIPQHVFRVALMSKTAFDPGKDLTYVIGLSGYIFGVVVKSDAPWKTFQELLADAKARPGKISYGTPGTGTTPHLVMAQIAAQQGIDWVHVPFKGSSETTNAVLGGYVDSVADGTSWGPMVDAGKLRLLVTWDARRTRNWPTVPTLRETGIDLVATAPYGIAGPKGMDPRIVQTLHDAFKKGMEEPSYAAALTRLDQEPIYLNSKDYHDFALREIADQRRLLENAGLKPD